jgi:hypothetical protein
MINIHGVTSEQAEILDQLWACETEEDVLQLRNAMDPDQWPILDILIETIAIALLDDEVHSEIDCEQVRQILAQF